MAEPPGPGMTRDSGLEEAIRTVGSLDAFARALGVAVSTVASWRQVPAEHARAVESLTGIGRGTLRPDYKTMPEAMDPGRDEIDIARSREYALLGALLLRSPDGQALSRISRIDGSATPLGCAHRALAEAAASVSAEEVEREYFDLFIGVGRGEIVPYASYYLTGFLNERPLARLRGDLMTLGLERVEGRGEPEDHLGSLCEVMSGLAGGLFEASVAEEEAFFSCHLAPWALRCLADIETATAARFYRAVGTVGRVFLEIEAEAFAMEAGRSG